jgi:bacterioferritin (cytochrome b1)
MLVSPEVIAVLQRAVNTESDLEEAYKLNGKILWEDFAIKTGKELRDLGKQSEKFKKKLVVRLRFYEINPEVVTNPAGIGGTVTEILDQLIQLEIAAVQELAAAVQICWDAKAMEAFHFFQHLCKWHTVGGSGVVGHLHYLEHERKQLLKLGENDYVAAHIV